MVIVTTLVTSQLSLVGPFSVTAGDREPSGMAHDIEIRML